MVIEFIIVHVHDMLKKVEQGYFGNGMTVVLIKFLLGCPPLTSQLIFLKEFFLFYELNVGLGCPYKT